VPVIVTSGHDIEVESPAAVIKGHPPAESPYAEFNPLLRFKYPYLL